MPRRVAACLSSVLLIPGSSCDFSPFLIVSAASISLGSPALDAQTPTGSTDPHMARARRVLSTTPLVDGHNDLPWAIREATAAPHDVEAYDLRKKAAGHTDLARLKTGDGRRAVLVDLHPGRRSRDSGYARVQLEQIDIARRVIAKYPERFQWALTADAVRVVVQGREDRLAARARGRARDREFARRAARLLRPRRALHDAHAQRHARLGRRRARLGEARRAHELRRGSRARDEPARHAGRSVARVAGRR